jgi:hypothetical protein
MIPADDVSPHEQRCDNAQDGNSDGPEAGEQQIHITSDKNVRSENAHNVSMLMLDRPHVLEVHALKSVRVTFYREKG